MIVTNNDWQPFFNEEQVKPYYLAIRNNLLEEIRRGAVICPAPQNIFRAFRETSFADTRVVILGQDPYHNPGQATGMAFAVPEGMPEPPSLQNIHKEIIAEGVEQRYPWTSDTLPVARQGVLMFNSFLTTRVGLAGAHKDWGWEIMTDRIIETLGRDPRPRVFILWGSFARSKRALITNPNHLILEAPHPSPFSANRGFFGCGHFRMCNDFLKAHGETPIYW